MNNYLKREKSIYVKISMMFLLLVSLMTSGITMNTVWAEEYEEIINEDESGAVKNRVNPIEYEDSILSKKATYTGNLGEYFVDLYVEGKSFEVTETIDIALVYDNSNSMADNNRATISHEAVSSFVSELLSSENNSNGNFRMALVTFGTDVFDGRMNRIHNIKTDDLSHKELTTDAGSIISKLPTTVPSERGQTSNGGTFTQEALKEAQLILANSNADHKHIITITDGVPTVSYNPNGDIAGNGTSFRYLFEGEDRTHGADTIAEAQGIQSTGINMSSIGIEITGGTDSTAEEAMEVMLGIASSPNQYYGVDEVSDLSDILKNISNSFTNSIVNGTVTDPMGDLFHLKKAGSDFQPATSAELLDGDYYLSASEHHLLNGVAVTENEDTITLDPLNVGENEWVHLRYKVQLDTENENFVPDTFFPTNDPTTLDNDFGPGMVRNFPIPEVSGVAALISGTKSWEDYDQIDLRPESIIIELWKVGNGEDVLLEEKTITAEDDWTYSFENYPLYDSSGNLINYYVKEVGNDDYEPIYSNESYDITNKLIENPGIELIKTSDVEYITEVGEVITYTFEVRNTGNVPLYNIEIVDEMIGEEIELESTTLLPNEVTTGTITYVVTQEDLDNEGIENIAIVSGETPIGTIVEDEAEDFVISVGPVIVEYVDTEGNELAPSDELIGSIGEPYETNPKEIDGYELVEVIGNETGEFTEGPQKVTYIYEKIEAPAPDPDPDPEPDPEPDKKDPAPDTDKGDDSSPKPDSGKKLPITATNLYNILAIGLVLIGIGSITGYIYYRRKKLS